MEVNIMALFNLGKKKEEESKKPEKENGMAVLHHLDISLTVKRILLLLRQMRQRL